MTARSSPLEEARAFRVREREGWSQAQIASAAGVGRPYVNKRLALLELDTEAARICELADLGFAHLYALCRLPTGSAQRALAARAAREAWSVRTLERVVERELAGLPPTRRDWPGAHPDALELAHELEDALQAATSVPIEVRVLRRGRFEIRYVAQTAAEARHVAVQLGAHPTASL